MVALRSTCAIPNSTGAGRFNTTDTKRYVPVVTLSTQDNAKLLQQLKFGFKRTINWNKYQSKISIARQNQYLDFLSFQGVNRLFVLSFENENVRTAHTGYYLPKVDQSINNILKHMKTLEKLLLVKEMITKLIVY